MAFHLQQEYVQAAVQTVAERFHTLATLSRGRPLSESTRWSDVICPWLWLAAEEGSGQLFQEALAELAEGVPTGIVGWDLDGPSAFRELWRQTCNAFRIIGVRSAHGLLACVQAQRDNTI